MRPVRIVLTCAALLALAAGRAAAQPGDPPREQIGDFWYVAHPGEGDADSSHVYTIETDPPADRRERTAVLGFGCLDGEMHVFLSPDEGELTEDVRVSWRAAGGEWSAPVAWRLLGDRTAVLPGEHSAAFNHALHDAARVEVRYHRREGAAITYVFSLAGYHDALARLPCLEGC